MKHFLKAATAAGILSVAALQAQANTVLIANEPGPNRGARAHALEYLAEQIKERTNGSVTVDQNWGGALFKANAALDSLSAGVADMGVIIGAYAESEFPELQMGGLLLKPAHPWVMMKAMYELFTTNEYVKGRMEEMNLVYVNSFSLSPGILACRGEGIRTVADIKGTKVAHTGASGEIFAALGGNMVKMPIYDVFQGMETGLIDCSVTYAYFAVATNLNEQVDTMVDLKLSTVTSLATFINKFTFDSLSPEEQEAILSTGADMTDYYGEYLQEADDKAMAALAEGENAVEFVEFPAEEYPVLHATAGPLIEKWKQDVAAHGGDGEALLAELYTLMDKWTAVMEAEGLPWDR
ncbi:C4-dicarboxylate TRAP transporter substrate-binding protein [Pseudooceanicola nanhaiensis]|uniref:C4-dicarboxylate TRAP transporter substrate-binding protein n=1 Tax=Pseudooceanicola nanhaiensis TaxID=375761 RepID=UPI001CD3A4EE|nr:C4-dicarboxylate TRAP transporter substrate-binding protein [Pseudooceanicola nanhaiensis]MCA0922677.1 C4-dicarboxylate TRAP transporter substrate-binding protein [Pseudooceanicola nanhaiensis]